mgnify:CR=1 FL=1
MIPIQAHPLEHPAERQFNLAASLGTPVARGLLHPAVALAAVLPAALKAAPEANPQSLSTSLSWTIRDHANACEISDREADREISKAIAPLLSARKKMRVVGEAALAANAGRLPRHTVREIIEREAAWWIRLNAEVAEIDR